MFCHVVTNWGDDSEYVPSITNLFHHHLHQFVWFLPVFFFYWSGSTWFISCRYGWRTIWWCFVVSWAITRIPGPTLSYHTIARRGMLKRYRYRESGKYDTVWDKLYRYRYVSNLSIADNQCCWSISENRSSVLFIPGIRNHFFLIPDSNIYNF
jgi:hypothetical protein